MLSAVGPAGRVGRVRESALPRREPSRRPRRRDRRRARPPASAGRAEPVSGLAGRPMRRAACSAAPTRAVTAAGRRVQRRDLCRDRQGHGGRGRVPQHLCASGPRDPLANGAAVASRQARLQVGKFSAVIGSGMAGVAVHRCPRRLCHALAQAGPHPRVDGAPDRHDGARAATRRRDARRSTPATGRASRGPANTDS